MHHHEVYLCWSETSILLFRSFNLGISFIDAACNAAIDDNRSLESATDSMVVPTQNVKSSRANILKLISILTTESKNRYCTLMGAVKQRHKFKMTCARCELITVQLILNLWFVTQDYVVVRISF